MRKVMAVLTALMVGGCTEDRPEQPPGCPDHASGYTDKESPPPPRCVVILTPIPGIVTEVDRKYWRVHTDSFLCANHGVFLLEAENDPRAYVSVAAYTPSKYALPERDRRMEYRRGIGAKVLDKGHGFFGLANEIAWFTYQEGDDDDPRAMRGKVACISFRNRPNLSVLVQARWPVSDERVLLKVGNVITGIRPLLPE